MRVTKSRIFLSAALLLIGGAAFAALEQARVARRMVETARHFLDALTPAQREQATFQLDDPERKNWHFTPIARKGLPIKAMSQDQRFLAMALLSTGLSTDGFVKATTIISLEEALRIIEGGDGRRRDPELYFFSIFGTPATDGTWGWRVEGHHLSLNFTVVRGNLLATTPMFLGSNPARVPSGPRAGLRALAAEEDLGRALMESLDPEQQARAMIADTAPADISTRNDPAVTLAEPEGLSLNDMTPRQRDLARALIREYADNAPADLAAERWVRAVETAHIREIVFAWAGPTTPGAKHYYRMQGPRFLIEYDNTQNDGNHIHSVWRDPERDWGLDLLARHHRMSH